MKKPYYQDSCVTLYHGDAREIMPTFAPGSIDMILMDPPYGHTNHEGDLNGRLNSHRGIENKPIANDDQKSMRELVDFLLIEAVKALNPDCCCCCCCCCGGGPRPTFAWLANRMDEKGMSFFHSIIWNKVNPGLGWRYRRQHEMIFVGHLAKAKLLWRDDNRVVPNIVSFSKPREGWHPNEKPMELCGWLLENHLPDGKVVLDPCAGSGTTLMAARDRNHKAIGIELDEAHCEAAAIRLSQSVFNM